MSAKETKELVEFIVALASAVGKELVEHRFSFVDVVKAFQKAGPAFANIRAVVPELQHLTADDRAEIMAAVAGMGLPGAPELIVEKSIQTGLLIAELAATLVPAAKAKLNTGKTA